jgi:hypothetical protein
MYIFDSLIEYKYSHLVNVNVSLSGIFTFALFDFYLIDSTSLK